MDKDGSFGRDKQLVGNKTEVGGIMGTGMRLMLYWGVCIVIAGCSNNYEGTCPQEVLTAARNVCGSFSNGARGYDVLRTDKELAALVMAQANAQIRKSSARKYASMLLEVDLQGQPYPDRESATRQYRHCVGATYSLLGNVGEDISSQIDFLATGMRKYKASCLDVDNTGRHDGETLRQYADRIECAAKLRSDYRQVVSEWKRIYMPNFRKTLSAKDAAMLAARLEFLCNETF